MASVDAGSVEVMALALVLTALLVVASVVFQVAFWLLVVKVVVFPLELALEPVAVLVFLSSELLFSVLVLL